MSEAATPENAGPLAGLGVVLGGHRHSWPALLELAGVADQLGADSVVVDGDIAFRPSLPEAPLLHSWSTTLALLAALPRAAVGSMRIAPHWNAVALANAVAAAEAIAPGRLRLSVSIGGQPAERRAGLFGSGAAPSAAARIRWLDELLDALRELWRGAPVDRAGEFVHLDRARIAALDPPPAVAVGGRGPALLGVVARRADAWDINLPPVARLVAVADDALARACDAIGRDPATIRRSMWIALRVDRRVDDALRREYRALHPWFGMLGDDEIADAVVAGSPAACRERLAELSDRLRLDQPLLDLSGLDRDASLRSLERLA